MQRQPYRNQKILDAARGEACTICEANDGTTVAAHLNESWAGKGAGQKADDCAVMFLCARCHDIYDRRIRVRQVEDWEVLRAMYRTIRRLLDIGVLK